MQGKPVEQEWKKWCEFLTTNPMPASTMLNVPKEAFEAGYLAASARLATYEAALRPLASLPIGPEIEDDHDLVIYKNAGRSITVGDILTARKALEDNK